MKFVCYSDWNQLPANSDTLFHRASKASIFYSRQWFEVLAEFGYEDDHTLILASVVSGDSIMAVLPMRKTSGNTWYAARHRYTPHFSLLIADDNQQAILTCLAEGLGQLPLNGLLLEPITDDDGNIHSLQAALETAGFKCERLFRRYNWMLRVISQTFEDYMAKRPANLRNTINRKERKLEREHGYNIRLYTGEGAIQAMNDYYAVYDASWKASEQHKDLVDRMVSAFSAQNWTRLAVLYIKGQPAAAQLWFVHYGKASIFRLAYDEAWKRYSPGSILTRFLMQYVMDTDKVDQVDFLAGNDKYKQDWMSDRREQFAFCFVKTKKPTGWLNQLIGRLKYILKK